PYPYPNDLTTNLSLAPFSAAKFRIIYAGSVPGDKMNTIGVAQSELANVSFISNGGGSLQIDPRIYSTILRTLNATLSSRRYR
ncbi:MAG: hypothetical protein EZS28_038923, partial [Streblomastix strix]